MLVENNIAISMTQTGSPYDNAIAERVNGILKAEFDLYASNVGLEGTAKKIAESIQTYNLLRPHASCNYLTPEQAHLVEGVLEKRWRNKRPYVPKKQVV
jgi:putative transposase